MKKKLTQEEGLIENRKMVSQLTKEICESGGFNEKARPYVEVAVAAVLCDVDRTLQIVFDSQKHETSAKCWSHSKMYELISLALRTAYYADTDINDSPSREFLNMEIGGITVERIIVATCTSLVFSENIVELVVEFQKNIQNI